jgi:pyruvate,water dikinase
MMEILWLGDSACHVAASVGGKAANLSRLAQQFLAPHGFCLPAGAWRAARALGHSDDEALTELPPAFQARVTEAYRDLAVRCGQADPSVAVRSSAIDEDGATASFAGQHETYLNVIGAEAVGRAIARCWSSGRAERALAYRRQHGLAADSGGVAVLVQQLIPADVSAVVFSANPASGSREEIVVTASWGLGESIVGGSVTPDTYVVRKDGLALARRDLGRKARMTVLLPSGTREVDAPQFLRTRFALTDAQVVEAARLALALEGTMGWPVDVECAWHGGRLALLQCRPITTLPAGVPAARARPAH